jgi:hypothetical protein
MSEVTTRVFEAPAEGRDMAALETDAVTKAKRFAREKDARYTVLDGYKAGVANPGYNGFATWYTASVSVRIDTGPRYGRVFRATPKADTVPELILAALDQARLYLRADGDLEIIGGYEVYRRTSIEGGKLGARITVREVLPG